ncbi:hypothetical protein HAX54_003814 [Datura stramonium]|uniref:Uncharacterized protein n=1 Tax=Datura stramonium TaxID=4076 RepID=A0ABS8T5X0_DATST|nr:hypothetical protein [Datura stramonium]
MDVLLGELQVSMFYHILYEQKIHELAEACQSFNVQITSKDKDIKLERKRERFDSENEDLNTQLAAYGPAIFSLSQCISSLEKHSYLHGNSKTPDNDDTKDIVVAHPADSTRLKDNENAVATDAFSDLHGLEIRVRSVEKAMAEMEQLVVQENVNMHSKLQAAMQQIEELKSESGLHRRNSAPRSEIFEAEKWNFDQGVIMLDHVSECSSYRNDRREQAETNNLVFDLWDTANPTVGKAKLDDTPNAENDIDFHKPVMSVKKKCQRPASDVLGEKDWGDGKLNISKRSTESIQEGNKRKVLQRLDSDVQKLTNLQITVLDLKRELEITEKGKRGKAVAESETLKGQLSEAEAAICQII